MNAPLAIGPDAGAVEILSGLAEREAPCVGERHGATPEGSEDAAVARRDNVGDALLDRRVAVPVAGWRG